MIWTDTFANNRQSDIFSTTLGENNARLAELNRQDIRVIIGNPPYSVGQDNANDDNQNDHYEELDDRIAKTYAARTEAVNKNSLYDSYIRAYRWASDRIGDTGIMALSPMPAGSIPTAPTACASALLKSSRRSTCIT